MSFNPSAGTALIQTKSFWGAAAAISAGLAGLWNYHITPADIASATEAFTSIVGTVGGLLALYGRITATAPVTGVINK